MQKEIKKENDNNSSDTDNEYATESVFNRNDEIIDEQKQKQNLEMSRVHFLDPDFLVFAMPFAVLIDLVDIILELTSFVVIPKLLGMVADVVTFAIIGGWMYWRTGRMADAKKQQQEQMGKKLAEKASQLSKKAKKQVAQKVVAKQASKKVFARMGLVLIGELIPFVGLIPFWTISVISTLRKK